MVLSHGFLNYQRSQEQHDETDLAPERGQKEMTDLNSLFDV